MTIDDPYFKKTVTLNHAGRKLEFAVSQELFSSHDVDAGTRLLLRTLQGETPSKVLDIGCGYGPIGLALKAASPSLELHMTDRDALALRYAARNVVSNDVDPVEVYASLGYDDVVDKDFDLVVMNLPAKAGREAIEHFLMDAREHLVSGGKVAVVVVAPLDRLVSSILDRPGEVELVLRRASRSYVAFHYRYKEGGERFAASGFERGVYGRGRASFSLGSVDYELTVAHDLPEFDTLSYSTELAASLLGGATHRFFQEALLIHNPGQGHLPVSIGHQSRRIQLVDRDLLALRMTEKNLLETGFHAEGLEVIHAGDLSEAPGGAGLLVDLLRPKEPPLAVRARLDQASSVLDRGATVVLAGASTPITRALNYVEGRLGWRVETRTKRKGHSAVVLRR